MATRPNPQLEAAIRHFGSQAGAVTHTEAQLRNALTADADLARQLNQQAAAGQLRAFALEAPGNPQNLTGRYDKSSGTVTLPESSFLPSGTIASDDLKAVVKVQAMTAALSQMTYQDAAQSTHTVSQDMVSNLQSVLNGSPVLASQMKEAVRQGHVQHFGLLDGRMAAGATYDGDIRDGNPKGINLPLSACKRSQPPRRTHDMTRET